MTFRARPQQEDDRAMSPELLRLTDAEIRALRVVFAAPFAPEIGAAPPPAMDPVAGVKPKYHYEVDRAMREIGLAVAPCRLLDDLPAACADANFVFSLYSRAAFRNCEVYVATVCERAGIAHMGAPPNIRALAEDKLLTKLVAAHLGIPVPPGRAYVDAAATEEPPGFDGPYFVKYRFGATSEGISEDCICETWPEARARALLLLSENKEPLVERLVPGTDVTVPVLGGHPPVILPAAEEISELRYGISTFRQKRLFERNRRREMIEDPLLLARIDTLVRRLFPHVDPFDYIRIDFRRQRDTGELQLIEFNIGCNIGSHAAIMQAAAHVGLPQRAVIEHVIAHSVRRQSLERRTFTTENV